MTWDEFSQLIPFQSDEEFTKEEQEKGLNPNDYEVQFAFIFEKRPNKAFKFIKVDKEDLSISINHNERKVVVTLYG